MGVFEKRSHLIAFDLIKRGYSALFSVIRACSSDKELRCGVAKVVLP
jgi:hypothetical protein